jgi:hypothetical protein
MKKLACIFFLLSTALAQAQSQPKSSIPASTKIVAGLTYQQLIPTNGGRSTLTVQNNNTTTDNCFLLMGAPGSPWQVGDTTATSRTINGVTLTAQQASILLLPGGSDNRLSGIVPSDQFFVTCATTGDSFYADYQ